MNILSQSLSSLFRAGNGCKGREGRGCKSVSIPFISFQSRERPCASWQGAQTCLSSQSLSSLFRAGNTKRELRQHRAAQKRSQSLSSLFRAGNAIFTARYSIMPLAVSIPFISFQSRERETKHVTITLKGGVSIPFISFQSRERTGC